MGVVHRSVFYACLALAIACGPEAAVLADQSSAAPNSTSNPRASTTSTAPRPSPSAANSTQPATVAPTTRTVAPTVAPTQAPTVPPTVAPTARPTVAPTVNRCGAPPNPWNYTFCGGSFITNPPSTFCSYFNCIATFSNGRGYVMQCSDGTFSKSGGISGSCSGHGGNARALYAP